MVITGKDWSGRVRNDQDLSGIIRTGQESYGNFNIFLIFSKLAQEILTCIILRTFAQILCLLCLRPDSNTFLYNIREPKCKEII